MSRAPLVNAIAGMLGYILDNAILTDGGKLHVPRRVFSECPGMKTAAIAIENARQQNVIDWNTSAAGKDDDMITLNRSFIERKAEKFFCVKADASNVQLTDPAAKAAFAVMKGISVTEVWGSGHSHYISSEALQKADPGRLLVNKGYVDAEIIKDGGRRHGMYLISDINALERLAGVTRYQVSGRLLSYPDGEAQKLVENLELKAKQGNKQKK